MKRKLITRTVLVLACVNFILSIWFSQYIVTGWLLYLYVMGSFALMCLAMVIGE